MTLAASSSPAKLKSRTYMAETSLTVPNAAALIALNC